MPRLLFGANNPNLLNSTHYAAGPSYYRYAVSPDGQRFLVPQPSTDPSATRGGAPRGTGMLADVIVAEVDRARGPTIQRGGVAPNEIAVVLNWPRLLKQNGSSRDAQ